MTPEEGRPVLPESLESIPKAHHFPTQRHRWNTNEEIAAILISFERHEDWLSKEVKIRPKSGSMLLYSRKRVRYRRDGYCWKKRKDGKTTREDHMKLKVQGTECIYGCYVHSAILPTFHRRCYWLLQNPDIVLVHYLNVPYSDDNKLLITPSLSCCADKKEWTKEELISQLKPMFYSENKPDLNNELEISMAETVEAIVQQLMEKQRCKAAVRNNECPCDNKPKVHKPTIAGGNKCSPTLHCIISPKTQAGTMAGVCTASTSLVSTAPVVTPATAVVPVSHSGNHKIHEVSKHDTVTTTSAPTVINTPRTGSVILATPCRPLLHDTRAEVPNISVSQTTSAAAATAAATSLILNLSQLQGGGGLLILNSAAAASRMGLTSASVTPVTLICNPEPATTTTTTTTTSSISAQSTTCSSSFSLSSTPNFTTSVTFKPKIEKIIKTEKVDIACVTSCKDIIIDNNHSDNNNNEPSSVTKANFALFGSSVPITTEDIQHTLSVSLPSNKSASRNSHVSVKTEPCHSDTDAVDLNPMDFIDNDISTPDEEVFNLDTFDMLTDLPNLDDLNSDLGGGITLSGNTSSSSAYSSGYLGSVYHQQSPQSQSAMHYREGTANIADYSPDWSYIEGGVKVLVIGPWYSCSSPYTILFDGVNVPTTLVQSGVLRCYCPAHDVGLVSLQVACEGFVISNSVTFEYRNRLPALDNVSEDWFNSEETPLKFSLLERLESMESKLTFPNREASASSGEATRAFVEKKKSFEDKLVILCQHLMTGSWLPSSETGLLRAKMTNPDLTLLHLASALGYSRLVCILLHWRVENSSYILESEIDALSQDSHGCTPLMWASALGHKEVALLLYQWNKTSTKLCDCHGRSALTLAKEKNFPDLAQEIERLENAQCTLDINTSKEKSSTNITTTTAIVGAKVRKLSLDLSPNSRFYYTTATQNLTSASSTATSINRSKSLQDSCIGLIKRSSVSENLEKNLRSSSNLDTFKRPSLDATCDSSTLIINNHRNYSNVNLNNVEIISNIKEERSCSPTEFMDTSENQINTSNQCYITVVNASDEESEGIKNKNTRNSSSKHLDDFSNCSFINSSNTEVENRVLTLAEQIIAAMPDRIKASSRTEPEHHELIMSSSNEIQNNPSLLTQGSPDLDMCPVEDPPPPFLNDEFNFEFSDHHTYRYCEVGTPNSSLSPASSSCLHSPGSFTIESPSPTPTTADFSEFLQASGKIMESDFSNLTLSDKEQRELYEAAKIIQKAYRSYKGRKRQEEEDKEKAAAILIQSYYRRYKQYIYYKQMTKAAQVIQSQFRSYCEHKRFKKSQDINSRSNLLNNSTLPPSTIITTSASSLTGITNFYRSMSDIDRRSNSSREGTPTSILKRTYSQRRQHQAARKIQQFMRQSKNNIWDYLNGKPITERACYSCRKRDVNRTTKSATSAHKLHGAAF